jgi:tetratricopeptide (TPR) repeat protein
MTGFEEAYYRAFALVNAGRNEEAIAAYKALEARDPRAPMVRYQLGRTLRRTKQYDQAQKELQEALRLAPDLAEAAFDIALVREDQGDAAGAETWIRKALAINAAYPEAHAALARLRFRAGDRDGARAEMQRAVALAPTDPMYRKALESLGAGAPR